jgi:pentapeptide repeat protein
LTVLHAPRPRPEPLRSRPVVAAHPWLLPLVGLEWPFEWAAYALSRWSFLAVLEYLGSFSILIAVIFYFSEAPDRLKQKHYQAWQVINTAQGKGGSGGRIEALQELAADHVPLVGVDVGTAFLQGIQLPRAGMTRANLNAVDARNSNFQGADLSYANLHSGNFRGSNLSGANLRDADLGDADLCSADLSGASLQGATLDEAELGNADLRDVKWQQLKSLKGTSLANVRNAPVGFLEWAAQHGGVTTGKSDCN